MGCGMENESDSHPSNSNETDVHLYLSASSTSSCFVMSAGTSTWVKEGESIVLLSAKASENAIVIMFRNDVNTNPKSNLIWFDDDGMTWRDMIKKDWVDEKGTRVWGKVFNWGIQNWIFNWTLKCTECGWHQQHPLPTQMRSRFDPLLH